MKKKRPSILSKSIGALLAIAVLAPLARAGQIWDGGGGDGLWSTNANWDADTAPSFASPLAFGGLLQLGSVNDATASVAGLTFNAGAGAFTLSGNPITLNGGILNSSANTQTVSFTAITLGSAQTFHASTAALVVTTNVDLGANTLTIEGANGTALSGVLSGTGALTKKGAGTLGLSGVNSYTGDTLLQGGSLFSNVSPGGVGNSAFGSGLLVISGGTRIGSVVDNQTIPNDISLIDPVSPITIEASTHLNLTGNIDLNGGTRTIVGNVNQAEIAFNGVISDGGLTFNTASLADPGGGLSPYVAFIFGGASTHTYTGLTTVNDGAFIVFTTDGQKISGDVLIQGNGVVDYLTGSDQISDTSTVTVNSTGSTIIGNTEFQGLELFNKSDTIGALFGTGTVGLGSGTLTVGAGHLTGFITDGERGFGGNFIKNTAGTLALAGPNDYTGTTTVTAGTLDVIGSITSTIINITGGTFIAGNSSALTAIASVTTSVGAGFEYHATTNVPLAIGTLTLDSGAGTTLGGSIGSTLGGAEINVTGDVTPVAGAINVNIFGIPGVAATATGTYTLLTGGGGSTLTAPSYSLGMVYNNTSFTVDTVTPFASTTATQLKVGITTATPLTAAYWKGGLPGAANVWAASDGTANSNWVTTPTGGSTALVPGLGADVTISANTVATAPTATVLGADMTIKSLTISDTANGLGINADGHTLTIAPSASTDGISIIAGVPATTIAANVALGADQTWTNNSANALTVGGIVSGAQELTKAGTGTLTLTNNNNTYTGGTRLLGGALFVDGSPGSVTNSALGTGILAIAGDTLIGSHVDGETITNDLSFIDPTGPVTIEAHTHLNFTGNADLNGGTRNFTGTVHASEIAFSGVIGSTGGPGGVTFTTAGLPGPVGGVNSYVAFQYNGNSGHAYTGLTTVEANAFLVFTNAGEKIRGDVLIQGNGVVDYLNAQNQTLNDQIADTASVTVHSPGSTIDTGVTLKFAGLELRNNSDTIGALFGSSAGTVGLGSGVLTVGAGNFSGVIGDGAFGAGGQLVKSTIGTLTLSGANTYTGNTNINNGTLVLDGSVQSPTVFVNFSGTLMGTGTAFHDVRNAGIFSPGNSTGTFRIRGNYFQSGAGTLVIEIAGTQAGQHDLVEVGGHAELDGNLRLVKVGGARLKVGDKVTFLTAAGGVSGEFANVENGLASTDTILETKVVYEANAVSLEATQGSFDLFAKQQLLTPNQRAVASMLDKVAADSGQKKLITFLNGESLERLPEDFDRIAPDELQAIYTIGTSQANVQTANLQRRMEDIRAGRTGFTAEGLSVTGTTPPFLSGGVSGSAGVTGLEGLTAKETRPPGTEAPAAKEIRPPAEMRYGVFITGTGEFAKVGGTERASGYDLASGGFTIGADYKVNEHFTVGLHTGYARTGTDGSGGSRVTVDGAKLGAYATYFTGEGFYADAAIQGGYNNYDTRRTALQGTASGSTAGGEFNGLLAAGFDFTGDALRIGPTASFQYTHIGFGGYEESGSLAPLRYGSQGSTSMRTALGMKAAYELRYGTVVVRPELRAAWQHEYGDVHYAIDSALAGGGPGFTVQGAEIGRESLLLGAGVAVLWNERTATYLFYDGELGRTNYSSNNVSAGVRMSF